MLKFRKSFWYTMLGLGAFFALSALVLLVLCCIKLGISLIPITVLSLTVAGGVALLLIARKSLTLLVQVAAPVENVSNKQKKLMQESYDRTLPPMERNFSRSLSLSILLLAAAVFLIFFGIAHNTEIKNETADTVTGVVCERGKVLSIISEDYRGQQEIEDVPVGNQIVQVELTSGKYAGTKYEIKNDLGVLYGTVLHVGDRVIVAISLENGEIKNDPLIWAFDRTIPLLIVMAAFLLITVLVGGKVGAKSLLSLLLTFVSIFTILIPLLINGWSTLATILGLCIFMTVVEFSILDGVNKKSVCAMLGTISGVILAAVFGMIASKLLRINGFVMNDADSMVEALLNFKVSQHNAQSSLQIGDLLVGGILIAALGAVNDVAMSISSAMNELISVNPELTRKDLFKSGMNIGRDMVGTMTNTLILALAGSSLVMMIYYSSLRPNWKELMSTAFLSVEAVQALASSVGVILAVPVTVLIGMFFYGHSGRSTK